MESENAIKQKFQARELDWLSAMLRLQNLGFFPDEAEAMVAEWNDENLSGLVGDKAQGDVG